ncbi:MAG: response regulator [Thermoanaerobacteraceae bacterium]|nr:response regulator [Thermoanaerobacteraceae bacterium]
MLIVEDDPMVASVNKRYVNMVEGFNVVGIARNADEAKEILKKKAELLLLDVYMPGKNGMEMLKDIRKNGYRMDVIMVTADSNGGDIDEALRYGVVDYLIKPFEFSRLKTALLFYKKRLEITKSGQTLTQDVLDSLIKNKEIHTEDKKGFDKRTMDKILDTIRELNRPVSAEDIARVVSISRVTAKKYLEYMEEQDILESEVRYGGTGRPATMYFYTT